MRSSSSLIIQPCEGIRLTGILSRSTIVTVFQHLDSCQQLPPEQHNITSTCLQRAKVFRLPERPPLHHSGWTQRQAKNSTSDGRTAMSHRINIATSSTLRSQDFCLTLQCASLQRRLLAPQKFMSFALGSRPLVLSGLPATMAIPTGREYSARHAWERMFRKSSDRSLCPEQGLHS